MPIISITYDNLAAFYFPGQTISGKVVVTSEKPFSCKAIELECSGVAKVHWSEHGKPPGVRNETQHQVNRTIYHRAEENYYSLTNKLWGDGHSAQMLPAGEHPFNFAFILPPNSPSSFESTHGYVRHTCKATLGLPMRLNVRCVRPFSVSCISDLNDNFFSKAPVNMVKDKTLGCLCCSSGNISFVAMLERSGFVPGQYIRVNGECHNESTSRIKSSSATLYQKITYRATHKSKCITREVCHVSRPEIPPGEEDYWPAVPLLVPPLPPSELPGCNIIDVKYFLEFTMRPAGLSLNLTESADIIIGTIPIYDSFIFTPPANPSAMPQPNPFPGMPPFSPSAPMASQDPRFPQGGVPSAPLHAGPSAPPPPYLPSAERYPNMPPPKYGLCVFGGEETLKGIAEHDPDYDVSDGVFTPQYATYNLP